MSVTWYSRPSRGGRLILEARFSDGRAPFTIPFLPPPADSEIYKCSLQTVLHHLEYLVDHEQTLVV